MLSWPGVVQASGLLSVEARPAPRPIATGKFDKFKKPVVMLPAWYHAYKADIVSQVNEIELPPVEFWFGIFIEYGIAYPKSTPAKLRIEGALCDIHKDLDNLNKGVLDSLQMAGTVADDSLFTFVMACKVRTNETPYIKFFIYGYNDSVKIQQVGTSLPGIYISR